MASHTDHSQSSPPDGTMSSFVDKLVTDPKQPPQTLLLSGYTGASSEEGHTRLYFDPQLADYVEIPDAAILLKQPIPAEQSPLGGSYLWVQRDAELIHGPIGGNRQKARFLEGRLQQDHRAASPMMLPPTRTFSCTDVGPLCGDVTQIGVHCHHTEVGVNCPPRPTTPNAGCPTPTTPQAGCPTPTTPQAGCPAPSHACPTHSGWHCTPTEVSPHCPTNVIPCHTRPVQCGGETSARFPCFDGQAGGNAPTQLPVQCQATFVPALCHTHPPVCLPVTLPAVCGHSHVVPCPPVTLPPQCLVTHFGPHCPPPTLPAVCGHSHVVLCPPVTLPPQCPVTHFGPHCPPPTLPAVCGHSHVVPCPPVTLPPQCLPVTHSPAVCPTHPPLCGPVTGTPGCAPSLAGCPSGIACNPQTIPPGNPGQFGFQGMGGFPG